MGTGAIAHKFAAGLAELDDAELVAVGSRARKTADEFGRTYGVPNRHASYEDLANDPRVDAIYVATPHPMHKENSILCLNAGKAVLCEKPFTVNAREAAELIGVARDKGVFLMEAMWTRFIPIVAKVRELVRGGAIGEVRMLSADFGFRAHPDAESRLFAPKYAGGSLLDVGVYAVSFVSMILGKQPESTAGLAHIGEMGVDEQGAWVFLYYKGEVAMMASAIRTTTPHQALVMGTEGHIQLQPPFWRGTKATLTHASGESEELELPYDGNGYQFEAAEVMRCVRGGKLESEVMPLDESLGIMATMDSIRCHWGLTYPME